ncbi:TolC family protein [Myroides sp. LJL116]
MKTNLALSNIKFLLLFVALPFVGFSQNNDLQQPQLQSYLEYAIDNNPNLKAQRLTFLAIQEQIQEAGEFDDPELSMGFLTKPMDIVGGKNIGDITLMQMLPWFGSKKAAKTQAYHTSLVQYQQYLLARQELVLEVKKQWFLLAQTKQEILIAQENKKLLKQLEDLAIAKFSTPNQSGSPGSMSDVLKIGLDILELQNNIDILENNLKREIASFNSLLNRELDTQVDLPSKVEQSEFLWDKEQVFELMHNNHPALQLIKEQQLAYKAQGELNKKMSYPMIGVGVQYMIIGKTSDPMLAMGSMNGKDMIMPMLSVSLPVFRKKYKSQQKQSQLYRQSAIEQQQNTVNTLEKEYYTLSTQMQDALNTISLYQKQLQLAQSTYNLVLTEFSGGKSNLTNVIEIQRLLMDYQLKQSQSITDFNTIVASIESLIGNNVTNTLDHE